MKILFSSLVAILLFATVNAKELPSRERQKGASQTGFEIPDTIDIGQAYEGERKEFSIPIKNVSNEKKTIDRVFYTCTCFDKVDDAPVNVSPNSESMFKVIFNSYKLKGKVGKTIWVKSGDELFKITVKAVVVKKDGPVLYLHKTAFKVDKGLIEKSKTGYTLMIRLSNTGKQPLTIEGTTCVVKVESPDEIKVILKKRQLEPDDGETVKIVLEPSVDVGTHVIIFRCKEKKEARLTIEITPPSTP